MSPLKKNVAVISAALMGFGLVVHRANAGTYDSIPINGNFSPWASVPVAATAAPVSGATSPDLVQLKVANDSNYIYMEFTFATAVDPTTGGGTYIGIDSDNNPATGYNIYSSTLIGSNAAYQNDYPFTQSGAGPSTQDFNSGGTLTNAAMSDAPAYFSGVSTTNEEVAIPINASETDSTTGGYNGAIFQTSTNSFTVEVYTGSSVLGPYLYTIAGPPVQSSYALTGSGISTSRAAGATAFPMRRMPKLTSWVRSPRTTQSIPTPPSRWERSFSITAIIPMFWQVRAV